MKEITREERIEEEAKQVVKVFDDLINYMHQNEISPSVGLSSFTAALISTAFSFGVDKELLKKKIVSDIDVLYGSAEKKMRMQ